MSLRPQLLLTCEHGGNRVPAAYRALFAGRDGLLASHRGWDRGALRLARALARKLEAPLLYSEVTRLLVDLNRSLDRPDLFHPRVRKLPEIKRRRILERYYHPHRDAVEHWVAQHASAARPIVHIGVHTFTPVRRGERRTTHIGLLFDPARPRELAFCEAWRAALQRALPRLRIDYNAPYAGAEDGLTTTLRGRFGSARYLGIELEVRRDLLARDAVQTRRITAAIGQALAATLPPTN